MRLLDSRDGNASSSGNPPIRVGKVMDKLRALAEELQTAQG